MARRYEKNSVLHRTQESTMDSATQVSMDPDSGPDTGTFPNNGNTVVAEQPEPAELAVILASLQTMRDGDFSVRLPGSWTGLAGKIADTFNEIVAANQQMAQELKRVGQAVGKEGKTRERIRVSASRAARGARWKSRSTRWSRTCCGPPPK